MGQKIESECKSLIHMIRSGQMPAEAAQEVGRCCSRGYKWWGRYCKDGWAGLQEQSRAPKHEPARLVESVRQTIRCIRSALEAEAHLPDKLSHIGAPSIRSRLKDEGIQPLPGMSTIEQVLRDAGMTQPRVLGKQSRKQHTRN